MKKRPSGTRLKQDLRSLVLSNFTSAFILLCGFTLLLSQTGLLWLSLAALALASCFLFGPKAVVLGEELLDAGHRVSPLRRIVPRSDVQEAWYGHVVWWRGAAVPGIQLSLVDGSLVDLPMSEFLGEKQMKVWFDQINTWASRHG